MKGNLMCDHGYFFSFVQIYNSEYDFLCQKICLWHNWTFHSWVHHIWSSNSYCGFNVRNMCFFTFLSYLNVYLFVLCQTGVQNSSIPGW